MNKLKHPRSRLLRKYDGREVTDTADPASRIEGVFDSPEGDPALDARSSAESHPLLRQMSPSELLLMCYEGAIRRLREAIDLEEQERSGLCAPQYASAGRILTRLRDTLNPSTGDLAAKLASVYSFLIDRIGRADGACDPRIAGDCVEILTTLKEGWNGTAADAEWDVMDDDEDSRKQNAADRKPGGARNRHDRRQRPARHPAAKGRR